MSKGSQNRTTDHNAYWESEYWEKSASDDPGTWNYKCVRCGKVFKGWELDFNSGKEMGPICKECKKKYHKEKQK